MTTQDMPTVDEKELKATQSAHSHTTTEALATDNDHFPKLITSTYGPDGLEAYVEVDSIAHSHWDEEPATLVTLIIAHVSPTQPLLRRRPKLLLHAPSSLRRAVTRDAEHDHLTFAVFAPAARSDADQERPQTKKYAAESTKLEWRDEGVGAVIAPSVESPRHLCTTCKAPPTSNDNGQSARCDRLDPKHLPLKVWKQLVATHKWPSNELASGEGVWYNVRTRST